MKTLKILPVLMIVSGLTFAQNNSSLNKKWDYMLTKAENYEQYKVIKKTELTDLWKSVQDSVSRLKTDLSKEKNLVKQQQDQIQQLQKQTEEVKLQLTQVSDERENMTFMGATVNKHTYATLLWIIIILLVAGGGFLFFLFNNSNRVTVQKTNQYEDLFRSFEEYKQSRMEVERKLKREVQTYMNKIEELKRR